MSRGQFNAIWRIAMIVCAILAFFTLLFVSCTRAPKNAENAAPIAAAPTQETPLPGSTVVLITPEPEPPEEDAEAEPTGDTPAIPDETSPDENEDDADQ